MIFDQDAIIFFLLYFLFLVRGQMNYTSGALVDTFSLSISKHAGTIKKAFPPWILTGGTVTQNDDRVFSVHFHVPLLLLKKARTLLAEKLWNKTFRTLESKFLSLSNVARMHAEVYDGKEHQHS